ncbi:hypothetical protein HanHA300_Chr04g0134291 [Helianthus annuus]|nr:hypothetical protein HanHA300_Chr04g0134291 [Helianthus annuus]
MVAMVPKIHRLLAVLGGASIWRIESFIKKKRGKAKNKGLRQAIALNNGPDSLSFDTEVTYSPIGTPNDWFTREVGSYMFGHFAFDKSSYNYVSDAEKNAMDVHLRWRFNFTEFEKHPKCRQLMDGLNAVYMKRYRSRKAKAKEEFLANGGETDVARARANIPVGMSEENWNKTVGYFLMKEHKDRSCANKSNHQKQLYTNRGGSSTYSRFCFKKDKTRLEAFKNGHTLKDGRFATELEEQKYVSSLFKV